MTFLNRGLIFTPEVFILCKKVWGPKGVGDHWPTEKEKPLNQ